MPKDFIEPKATILVQLRVLFVKVDINIQAPFGGGGGSANGHEAPAEGCEGEEGVEGVEGQQNGSAGGAMGFAANLMMKAHSLKEGVKEKSSGLNLGNVQVGSQQDLTTLPSPSILNVQMESQYSFICLCIKMSNSPQGKGSLQFEKGKDSLKNSTKNPSLL